MDSFTSFIKNLRDAAGKEANRIEDSGTYSNEELDRVSRGNFLDNAVLPKKVAQKNDAIRFGNGYVKYFDAGDYYYDKDAANSGYYGRGAQLLIKDKDGKIREHYGELVSSDKTAFNGSDAVPITGWRGSESNVFLPFSELKKMKDKGILVGIKGPDLSPSARTDRFYNDRRITDVRQSAIDQSRSWDAYANAYNKSYGTKLPLLNKNSKYSTTGTEITGIKQTGPRELTFYFAPGPNGE